MTPEDAYDTAKGLVEGVYAVGADRAATKAAVVEVADALLASAAAERARIGAGLRGVLVAPGQSFTSEDLRGYLDWLADRTEAGTLPAGFVDFGLKPEERR